MKLIVHLNDFGWATDTAALPGQLDDIVKGRSHGSEITQGLFVAQGRLKCAAEIEHDIYRIT